MKLTAYNPTTEFEITIPLDKDALRDQYKESHSGDEPFEVWYEHDYCLVSDVYNGEHKALSGLWESLCQSADWEAVFGNIPSKHWPRMVLWLQGLSRKGD